MENLIGLSDDGKTKPFQLHELFGMKECQTRFQMSTINKRTTGKELTNTFVQKGKHLSKSVHSANFHS